MKKNYIIPSQRVHVLDTKEYLLANSQNMGDVFGEDPTGNFESDAREEKSFEGNNLWDEEW